MKRIFIFFIALALTGCSYLQTTRVKVLQEGNCTYIANMDTLLQTYVIHKPEVNYGVDLGYQGVSAGFDVREHREFVALQAKLNQQSIAINSMIKALIIQGNKSCDPDVQKLVWKTINNLIDTLAVVYAPVLKIKAESGIIDSAGAEYVNPERKELPKAERSNFNVDNLLRIGELIERINREEPEETEPEEGEPE